MEIKEVQKELLKNFGKKHSTADIIEHAYELGLEEKPAIRALYEMTIILSNMEQTDDVLELFELVKLLSCCIDSPDTIKKI